jgi:isoleucyl-tRNA synthetase
MDFRYQAAIVRALGKFVEQGMVYKGKKPVHWCIALPHGARRGRGRVRAAHLAVDLRRVPAAAPRSARRELAARVPALGRAATVSVLIWTTTPWTIPSNLAVAFHPDFRVRGLRRRRHDAVIVAERAAPGGGGERRARARRAAGRVEGRR